MPEARDLLRTAAYSAALLDADGVISPETRASPIRRYADFLETMGEARRAEGFRERADELAEVPAEESPWLLTEYQEEVLKETPVIRLPDLTVRVGQPESA